jgi:glutathione S-transferase
LAEYPQLWPSDQVNRALARSLSAEMAASFGSLRGAYPMNLRQRHPFVKQYFEASPGIARDLARITIIFSSCRARVNERKELKKIDEGYLFGAFTAVDAMFAPVCWRIKGYTLPVDNEVAKEYVERICSCELVQEWVQEAAKETQVLPSDEIDFQ